MSIPFTRNRYSRKYGELNSSPHFVSAVESWTEVANKLEIRHIDTNLHDVIHRNSSCSMKQTGVAFRNRLSLKPRIASNASAERLLLLLCCCYDAASALLASFSDHVTRRLGQLIHFPRNGQTPSRA
jgi:hypothetical protein